MEWALHLVQSGVGTSLIVNALLILPLLHSQHHATTLGTS